MYLPIGNSLRNGSKDAEADLESLKLDTIKPGDHLELLLDGESSN